MQHSLSNRNAQEQGGREEQAAGGNKVTRYDIINKNFILPQGQYPQESSYTGTYKNNNHERVMTEKITYPQNQVIPKGKFEGGSSYLYDYINSKGNKGQIIKRNGELKVGGQFSGESNYV